MPESAFHADRAKTRHFGSLLGSADWDEVDHWQRITEEERHPDRKLNAQMEAEVRSIYDQIVDDVSVREVMTNSTTAENISQAAAMNGTVNGSSATRLAAAEQGAGTVAFSCPHISFFRFFGSARDRRHYRQPVREISAGRLEKEDVRECSGRIDPADQRAGS